jgi:hypothetical protein
MDDENKARLILTTTSFKLFILFQKRWASPHWHSVAAHVELGSPSQSAQVGRRLFARQTTTTNSSSTGKLEPVRVFPMGNSGCTFFLMKYLICNHKSSGFEKFRAYHLRFWSLDSYLVSVPCLFAIHSHPCPMSLRFTEKARVFQKHP